jgi:hypothetical protein
MKTLKIIFKVIMTLVLLAILLQVFRAIGFTTLGYFNIDTSLEFGANIKASIEIFSFLLALFLSIKSFKSKKYLKWTALGLFSLLIILVLSVVTTKIILQNSAEVNSSLEMNRI